MYPNTAPNVPPIIRRGKNIPPGAPEPKLIIENKNLATSINKSKLNAELRLSSSIIALMLHLE